MSDSDIGGEFGCWHLNTDSKCNRPYLPSGVDQSRALWTRIFTRFPSEPMNQWFRSDLNPNLLTLNPELLNGYYLSDSQSSSAFSGQH